MTLVELLLALALAALLASSVIAIFSAVAYGSSSHEGMRRVAISSRIVSVRFADAVVKSHEVEAIGADYVVLWRNDDNDDDARQNNEMELIERGATTNILASLRNPADTANFTSATAFRTLALASYPVEQWATGVTALTLSGDVAPPNTRLVNFRLTLARDDVSEQVTGAAALRN